MMTPTTDSPSRPADARARRRWWVFGTLGVSAATAVAVWFGLAASLGHPSWQDRGYRVLDDRSVTLTYSVFRPGAQGARCTLRALDQRFGVVGTRSVDLPAGGPQEVVRTDTLRTTTRAVTAIVRTCVSR